MGKAIFRASWSALLFVRDRYTCLTHGPRRLMNVPRPKTNQGWRRKNGGPSEKANKTYRKGQGDFSTAQLQDLGGGIEHSESDDSGITTRALSANLAYRAETFTLGEDMMNFRAK
ncbi:hypothetical protein Bbelb_013330 [Branchiostoma belcheri]|nr:hypothetical protein Bbelb_013330 [Branchiostoma belcheri]